MRKCVIPSCQYKNSYGRDKRSLFKCLRNVERARLWEKVIPGIDVFKPSDYICDAHFEESNKILCFSKKHGYHYYQLVKEAVPTIFNVSNKTDKNFEVKSSESINDTLPTIGESSLQHVVQEMTKAENILLQIKREDFTDTDTKIKVEKQSETCINQNSINEIAVIKTTPYEELRFKLDEYASVLPNSWRVSSLLTQNDELFIFSKEFTVADNLTLLILIEKSIVLNSNYELYYSIHGRSINYDHPNLPKVLNNIEVLLDIIIFFNSISVCQGLYLKEFDENKDVMVYKDNLGYYRHSNCTLASVKLLCYHCDQYTKNLLNSINNITIQNNLRIQKTLSGGVVKQKLS